MAGSKARHQRKGLIGPPTPIPAKAGRQTRSPLGRANATCLATMKNMVRSTIHQGVCRHSATARTQAGERRSKAVLWSTSKTMDFHWCPCDPVPGGWGAPQPRP
eukprot:10411018-Alexandrium_andersonii.AAC.1